VHTALRRHKAGKAMNEQKSVIAPWVCSLNSGSYEI